MLPPILVVQGEDDKVVDPKSAIDIERQRMFTCSGTTLIETDSLQNGIHIKRTFCGNNKFVQQIKTPDFGHTVVISKDYGHTAPFI